MGEVRALGALVVSRCGKKDITGRSNDRDKEGNLDNPCFTRCNGGNEGQFGECYPSEVDSSNSPYKGGRTWPIVPTFYARIQVLNQPTACDGCQWESKSCDDRQHHCTLVLSECTCTGLQENAVLEMVVVSVTGDGLSAGATWLMELEDKGFLAAFTEGPSESQSSKAVEFDKGQKLSAQHDPDTNFDPLYHHLASVPLLSAVKNSIAIAKATFTVKLKFDHSDRDDCDPLIGARMLLTDGLPTEISTYKSKLPASSEYEFKLAENCPDRDDAECLFRMVDIAEVNHEYVHPYVTLAVKASRTCVQNDGGDEWKTKGGSLTVETLN